MSYNLLLWLSLFFLAISSLSSGCVRMKCGDISQILPSNSHQNLCAFQSINDQEQVVQTIQQCQDDKETCAYSNSCQHSYCFNLNNQPYKYPGDECQNHKECLSGVCNFGTCKGNEVGEKCFEDYECGMGQFCNHKEQRCVYFRQIGESCDPGNYKCANWGNCFNGVCTELLSLPVGHIINRVNISGGSPTLCSSFTALFDIQKNELTCAEGYTLTGPIERSSINETCKYTLEVDNRVIVAEREPQCGMSKSGSYYCPLGYGDLTEQLSQIRAFLSKNPMCPKSSSINLNCKYTEGIEGRANALAALYLTKNLESMNYSERAVLIRNNDDCVKKMFNEEYWSNMEQDNTQEISESMRLQGSLWLQ